MTRDARKQDSGNDLLRKLGIKDSSGQLHLDDVEDDPESTTSIDEVDALKSRFQQFNQCEVLRPGMVVTWKLGLRNKRFPRYGQPAIVVQVLAEPILDEVENAGHTYWREPLDVVLGMLDPEGDMLTWHYDSRRFRPLDKA